MDTKIRNGTSLPCGPEKKREYEAPTLFRFGAVADLTNSASGVCSNDSDVPPACNPGNMAMQ